MPKKKTNKWSPKKIFYVFLVMVLGKLLGFLVFELLTLFFVRMLEKRGLPVEFDQIFWFVSSPLPAHLYWIFIYIGVIGGFFLGLKWWRIVYVEHRHWKNWKNN